MANMNEAGINKHSFDTLHSQRERIESTLGEELSWERLNNRKGSRAALYLPNRSSDDPEETLNDTADWMVSKYVKLVETVIPIVRELTEEFDADLLSDGETGG